MKLATRRQGFSIIELLAVLTILGVVAAIAIERTGQVRTVGNSAACGSSRGDIELQCQMWRRAHGTFPASDLSDIGASTLYFPGGLPTCPIDGSPYAIDSDGRVVGHSH
ncbi:hypothetical protein Pla175_33070 [Pirellulimonas nuda]|uniref:Type II secretion system protein G n=1 Tax=Pirellulimonas nuda TaxID=2528009 RepID=A0A518DEK9_9BACT|nr:hypothetical protein Pla175_33070 [Pirellulimonas nuda]